MQPQKPKLIYDGECRFCTLWMERWRARAGDLAETVPSQDRSRHDLPPKECGRAIQWIGADGSRASGAAAVLNYLALADWKARGVRALYRALPPFAWAVETAYRGVAANRSFFSFWTQLLCGGDLRPVSYSMAAFLFLRILALIYGAAFLSFSHQAPGLIGPEGILPLEQYFYAAENALGEEARWRLPSVLWSDDSEAAVLTCCWLGLAAAGCLFLGIAQGPCLVVLWVLYLSLTVAGQLFYQFQWDILLLEAGFLAIFLAPWSAIAIRPTDPPRIAHFLLVWLLFRVMFASAVVKVSSGDPAWWPDLTALEYHYFTQPIPTPLAWYAAKLPGWFQKVSVLGMFATELFVPFLFFGPRRLRRLAAVLTAALQVLILLTGNYGFFNFLVLALCILLLDDGAFRWQRRGDAQRLWFLPRWLIWPIAVVLLLASLVPLAGAFRKPQPWLEPLALLYQKLAPFRVVNGYGLFAVMTKERIEIIVQGSDDGIDWKTYRFRYKPGDPMQAPPWLGPYMPRLDWQMWFAALGTMRDNPWIARFLEALLRGSDPVLRLLEENPFQERPPRFIRALADDYRFTTREVKERTGAWWAVEPRAIYCREASLGAN